MTLWQIWICLYPMPHCGCVCSNSTLIMVPINFWRNSDLFKKKEHFSSSKIDKVRAFQRKSLKIFKENLSNTKHKSLKRFWSYYDDFEYQFEWFWVHLALKWPIWVEVSYTNVPEPSVGGGGSKMAWNMLTSYLHGPYDDKRLEWDNIKLSWNKIWSY